MTTLSTSQQKTHRIGFPVPHDDRAVDVGKGEPGEDGVEGECFDLEKRGGAVGATRRAAGTRFFSRYGIKACVVAPLPWPPSAAGARAPSARPLRCADGKKRARRGSKLPVSLFFGVVLRRSTRVSVWRGRGDVSNAAPVAENVLLFVSDGTHLSRVFFNSAFLLHPSSPPAMTVPAPGVTFLELPPIADQVSSGRRERVLTICRTDRCPTFLPPFLYVYRSSSPAWTSRAPGE